MKILHLKGLPRKGALSFFYAFLLILTLSACAKEEKYTVDAFELNLYESDSLQLIKMLNDAQNCPSLKGIGFDSVDREIYQNINELLENGSYQQALKIFKDSSTVNKELKEMLALPSIRSKDFFHKIESNDVIYNRDLKAWFENNVLGEKGQVLGTDSVYQFNKVMKISALNALPIKPFESFDAHLNIELRAEDSLNAIFLTENAQELKKYEGKEVSATFNKLMKYPNYLISGYFDGEGQLISKKTQLQTIDSLQMMFFYFDAKGKGKNYKQTLYRLNLEIFKDGRWQTLIRDILCEVNEVFNQKNNWGNLIIALPKYEGKEKYKARLNFIENSGGNNTGYRKYSKEFVFGYTVAKRNALEKSIKRLRGLE